MLQLSGGAAAALILAACGGGSSSGTRGSPVLNPSGTPGAAAGGKGIVFNTGSNDVTLFDAGANQVTGNQPFNAVVRWLSNEQHYWDGKHIWTYDFPDNKVQAIAIDPDSLKVTKQVPVEGDGPGHSFVLTPDNKRGFVNSAGSNFVAVVDPVAGTVLDRIETGAFP